MACGALSVLLLTACVTSGGGTESVPQAKVETNIQIVNPDLYNSVRDKGEECSKHLSNTTNSLNTAEQAECDSLKPVKAEFIDYSIFGEEGALKRLTGYTLEDDERNRVLQQACQLPDVRQKQSAVIIGFLLEQGVKLVFGAVEDALKEQLRQLTAQYKADAMSRVYSKETCFIIERGAVDRKNRSQIRRKNNLPATSCTSAEQKDKSCWGTDFQLIVQTKIQDEFLYVRPLRLIVDEPASKELNVSATKDNDHGWGIGITAKIDSFYINDDSPNYTFVKQDSLFDGDLFKGKVRPVFDGNRMDNKLGLGVPQYFSISSAEMPCSDALSIDDEERDVTAPAHEADCVTDPKTGINYTLSEVQQKKTKVINLVPIEADPKAIRVKAPAVREADDLSTLTLSVTVTEAGQNKPREAFLKLFESARETLEGELKGALEGAIGVDDDSDDGDDDADADAG